MSVELQAMYSQQPQQQQQQQQQPQQQRQQNQHLAEKCLMDPLDRQWMDSMDRLDPQSMEE